MALSHEMVGEALELLDVYDYLRPLNYQEERERFLAALRRGEQYTPSYRYSGFAEERAREIIQEIQAAAASRLDDRVVERLVSRRKMIAAIGSPRVTECSREIYGEPDQELVRDAEERFRPPEEETGEIGSSRVKEVFNRLFDVLGMDYGCRVVEGGSIRHVPEKQEVVLGAKSGFTARRVKRLVVHESTHAVRASNGSMHGHPALFYGTPGYEVAEEGLATFNEKAVGVFKETLPRITSRVVAVANHANGFQTLFQRMSDLGLPEERAFRVAYRVKRGLQDSSRSGGFLKDHIYFAGFARLEEHPAMAEKLYAGKIGFGDVGELDATGGIGREEHLSACRQVFREMDMTVKE